MNTLVRISKMLFHSNNLLQKVLEAIQALHSRLNYLETSMQHLQENRPERLLSAKEVAQILGVTVKTVRSWQRSGRLASQKIGSLFFYAESDVRGMR